MFDVLISAGHEGRTEGNTGAPGTGGNSQIRWTPIVANRATEVLRAHGISVDRQPADFPAGRRATIALFIHFDGSKDPCSSGASVGYKGPADQPLATAWKKIYSEYWPYKWMKDNFTKNLSEYFGYGLVETTQGEMVMELGEISCREQEEWLEPRLNLLGDTIAYFVSQWLDKGNVPMPPSGSN
ncbi:hypothetical protein [Neorhizobium galegae]|uniref:hypothetical protein n=1 Tax=Neorhizobium galegae TaxID=399 RepID=UPI002102B93E|nr:hypothetical protein [Neorhizobium galegae]MCQ1839244.1 hypothetical protein [Neorhizobium galegae]UIY31473.1 hypothetical protein LZK73_30880 [Neorhizobium galegae]